MVENKTKVVACIDEAGELTEAMFNDLLRHFHPANWVLLPGSRPPVDPSNPLDTGSQAEHVAAKSEGSDWFMEHTIPGGANGT